MTHEVQPYFKLPKGFELHEDEDMVELRHGGNRIAVFPATTVTATVILNECREYLERGVE